jgi:hypothetical protein
MSKKKILLINPAFPDSLWGFTRIHSLVGIQYGFLPLALPTLVLRFRNDVRVMLPPGGR